MSNRVDLSKFNNAWYKPGNFLWRLLWFISDPSLGKSGKARRSREG